MVISKLFAVKKVNRAYSFIEKFIGYKVILYSLFLLCLLFPDSIFGQDLLGSLDDQIEEAADSTENITSNFARILMNIMFVVFIITAIVFAYLSQKRSEILDRFGNWLIGLLIVSFVIGVAIYVRGLTF